MLVGPWVNDNSGTGRNFTPVKMAQVKKRKNFKKKPRFYSTLFC